MTDSNKNLMELLARLGFDEAQAQETTRDIAQGDAVFSEADQPAGEARALAHLHSRLQSLRQQQQHPRFQHRRWLWGAPALAAGLLIGLLLLRAAWYTPADAPIPNPEVTTASAVLTEAEELALWQLAIEQENVAQLQVDEFTIMEGLMWFEAAETDESATPGQARTLGEVPELRLT